MKFLQNIGSITKPLDTALGLLKSTNKGILSSRRTISGAIVTYALYHFETKGEIDLNGLILLGLGILPVLAITISEIFQKKESE